MSGICGLGIVGYNSWNLRMEHVFADGSFVRRDGSQQAYPNMSEPFLDFYRCPEPFGNLNCAGELSTEPGFFRFGPDLICFGQRSLGHSPSFPGNGLYDSMQDVRANHSRIHLPFDLTQVIDNLRLERYTRRSNQSMKQKLIRESYYCFRPLLAVPVRKQLQKLFFRGWDRIPFPRWPVDTTVEQIFETLMSIALTAHKPDAIPFVWFWPDGAPSCVMMTHDVETRAGADFCSTLMDIDDEFEMSASFQIVPEGRYPVSADLLDSIRGRGFEVNVQDLNHDGHLFKDRETFLARARGINRAAAAYGSRGFRAAAMYRNPLWYGALDVSYDLSIPNVAHLEPQRGGCCTIFPYFIGKILELPLTMVQDYSLFHILEDYSIELWKRQIALTEQRHGLISFIVHPDYIISERPRKVYRALLEYLARMRAESRAWFAMPGEIDTWWRTRARLRVVQRDGQWTIEGPGSERARIAFATLEGARVVYTVAREQGQAVP